MVGYRKDRFIYLMIPKNACTTYSALVANVLTTDYRGSY
jgi:hypothetical protein